MTQVQAAQIESPGRNAREALRFESCGAAGGASVRGLRSVKALSSTAVAQLQSALGEHGLLIFPAGLVESGELVAFADLFGDAARIALASPAWPGDIVFANSILAYELIERPFAAFLRNLRAADLVDVPSGNALPPSHPVIRAHPSSGRKQINVNPSETGYILGLSKLSSENLLEILFKAVASPAVTLNHAWTAGEVVLWDDFTFQQRRSSDPGWRRHDLYRTPAKVSRPRRATEAPTVHPRRQFARTP